MTNRCGENRESLSALLDGELASEQRVVVERHLSGCIECQGWFQESQVLRRTLSIHAEIVPDGLADRVMDRLSPPVLGAGSWVRYALGVVAASLAVLSLPSLFVAGTEHSMRHVGAFGVALGIGLAWAALRPERAGGLVPMALALAAAMVVSSAYDLATGRAAAVSEALHALELLGVALLVLLAGGGVSGLKHRLSEVRRWQSLAGL